MKILLISLASCLILATSLKPGKINPGVSQYSPGAILSEDCSNFNILNTKIRDGKISGEEALKQFQLLLPKIKLDFYRAGGKDFQEADWYFPVQNYDSKAIGGINGNGYIASKYNYFDGNKHLGHPAHDIFIKDSNQDGIDDLLNKQVNVLSMTGGIVIANDTIWNPTSDLRGGKYIWIFDPYSNSIFYYAHNSNVLARIGDIVKPGEIIATIGRTGFNANKKRSPTHLHLMQLKLDKNYYPKPYDCYRNLIKARLAG